MSRRNLFWLLGIIAVTLFGLTTTYSAPTREKDKDYELVRLLVDVLHEVRQKYVVEVDADRERRMVEDMINGGLERLDPHSQYINPREYRQFEKQSEGKFGGVGIQVGYDRQKGGQLTIISPLVGTPAYEAGIVAGDVILKIDGKATESMRMNEAVDMIQGEPGSKVKLSIGREGQKEPLDFEITRTIIKVPTVLGDVRTTENKDWEYFIDKRHRIAYVRLTHFGKTSAEELEKVMKQLEADGVQGFILDLRNNPGGLLKVAIQVADLFLTEGVIVSTKGRNHRDTTNYARREGTLFQNGGAPIPVVVLVNRYSASASEIVAAALQDHHRAIIIGERTYGKGSVQDIILLENETSALKLTTASYWRPSGKNIHRFPDEKDFKAAKIDPDEWGVRPDKGFEVKQSEEERIQYMLYRADRDVVREKPKAPEVDKDGKQKAPFVDRVLNRALEHLREQIDKAAVPTKKDA